MGPGPTVPPASARTVPRGGTPTSSRSAWTGRAPPSAPAPTVQTFPSKETILAS